LAEKFGVIVQAPRYEGSFPCSPVGAREVRRAVAAFAKTWLSGRDLSDFEAAVGEVVANAAEHGGGDTITVECYLDMGRVVAEIGDRGPGFRPPAAIEPPRGAAPRGYGLFIVHRLLDEVEFLDRGRTTRLVKAPTRKPT
jgi:anti-sigma regulatory factor (Ser/Thr protein kinase)